MKILFFSYYNPLGKGGFEKQAMGLMKTLANQGHEIACLTISTPENQAKRQKELEVTEVFKLGSFVITHQEKGYSLKAKLLFWFDSNPVEVMVNETSQLKSEVNSMVSQIIDDKKIDVIHCLSLRATYYLTNFSDFPLILDLVDSYSLLKKRSVLFYLSQLKIKNLLFSCIDCLKTTKIEKQILKIYLNSPIAIVSPLDQRYLIKLQYQSLVSLVSHPLTIKVCNDTRNKNQSNNKIITFYGFFAEVNSDALNYLVQDILPIVIKKYSDLKLLITGINLSKKIFDLEKQFDWIKVIPTVDNIEEFSSQATLNCWPFRLGSGFKNKISESMALSKPVVTTTIGAEALTESQKKGLLIADTAQQLADHIIYLLDNPNERLRLGEINYQISITDFTWEKKVQDYLKLYQLAQQQINGKTYDH